MKQIKLLFTLILLSLTGIVSAQITQGFNADSVFNGRTSTSAIVLHGNKIWLPDIPTFGSASSKFIGFNGTKLITRTAAQVRSDIGAGTGSGTVTGLSIVTANGVSGSVATSTTTPAITLTLGAITPITVVASGAITGDVLRTSQRDGYQIGADVGASGFYVYNMTDNRYDLKLNEITGAATFINTITATNFSGTSSGTNTGDQTSVTGNAGTATALQTARTINGTSFDGTANITVTAAAGTLTGTTLNSGVTSSSLISVGTISSGTWSGLFGAVTGANLTNITAANISAGTAGINISGNAATVTTNANLTGDVTSSGNASTVVKINGTLLSGLATGLLQNTTSTGVPTIASGTGFLKLLGTSVTYDNSTYLTTSSASSTYLPLSGGALTGSILNAQTSPTGISLDHASTFPQAIRWFDSDDNEQYVIGTQGNGGGGFLGLWTSTSGTAINRGSGTPSFRFFNNGGLTISGGLGINGTSDNIKGSTYTPTAANLTGNLSSVTVYLLKYMQVGNTVTVTGVANANCGVGSGFGAFEIALPVASNITGFTDLSGVISSYALATSNGGYVSGIAGTDRAEIRFQTVTATGFDVYFTFSYVVQ